MAQIVQLKHVDIGQHIVTVDTTRSNLVQIGQHGLPLVHIGQHWSKWIAWNKNAKNWREKNG